MPIYEYACLGCGKQIEVMQKISDAPLAVCEACGGKLEKQWSQTGFQFKGAGWYVTDYAGRKSETGKDDAKSGGDKAADAAGATKTDAAPKSETKNEPAKSETKSDAASTPAPAANAKS